MMTRDDVDVLVKAALQRGKAGEEAADEVAQGTPLEREPAPKDTPLGQEVWPVAWEHAAKRAKRRGLADQYTERHVRDAVELMPVRHAQGLAKYGTPLKTHNGRNHLRDALQEAMDGYVYLFSARLEHDDVNARDDTLTKALDLAFELVVVVTLLVEADPFRSEIEAFRASANRAIFDDATDGEALG